MRTLDQHSPERALAEDTLGEKWFALWRENRQGNRQPDTSVFPVRCTCGTLSPVVYSRQIVPRPTATDFQTHVNLILALGRHKGLPPLSNSTSSGLAKVHDRGFP